MRRERAVTVGRRCEGLGVRLSARLLLRWTACVIACTVVATAVGGAGPEPPPAHDPPVVPPTDYAASFDALLALIGERYPAFELKSIDWDAVSSAFRPRVQDVRDDQAYALLCIELIAQLRDSHARLELGDFELHRPERPRWDAGFTCLLDDRQRPVVYDVDPGGPAAAAGIAPGAEIVALDGTPADALIAESLRRQTRWQGFSSERAARYRAVRDFHRSVERGATQRITIRGVDGNEREVELAAMLPPRYQPRLPVPIAGINDSANVAWKMLDDAVGYIYVRRIRSGLEDALDRALLEMPAARALIIDVRGNSGGGFDNRRAHLNFDAESGAEARRPRFTGPIALLLDARCVSAGEGWASWFIARDRATTFGETTTGASARKIRWEIPSTSFTLVLPVKLYRGALDRPIEFRGLEPQVPLLPAAADLQQGRDTVLDAAQRHLQEVIASGPPSNDS